MHNITCTTIYFFIFHFKALLILSLRCSDMRRAKSREEQKRETREQSRARAFNSRKRKEREREKVHVGFLLPFFFFKGVVVVDFFAFFRPNLGAQIEALESFTKREIPQRYKI